MTGKIVLGGGRWDDVVTSRIRASQVYNTAGQAAPVVR